MATQLYLPHVKIIHFFTAECEAMSRLAQTALNDKNHEEVSAGFSVEYNPYESRYEGEIYDLQAIPEDLIKYVNSLFYVTTRDIKAALEEYCLENELEFSDWLNGNDTFCIQINDLYMAERHTGIILFIVQEELKKLKQ